jgi:flagellin
MTSVVLSSAVRQNLLALQSTASLMASTQNNLSTGNKVNSALDNPTNFFTAQGLSNRSSDISNLLDGISNGVQVLQAANTGLTSLQSLVGQAKSVANQALQTSIGYSTKAGVTSAAISGATSSNLLGTITYTSQGFTGTTGAAQDLSGGGGSPTLTGGTVLGGTSNANTLGSGASSKFSAGDTITVNGTTISIVASGATGNQLNVSDNVTTLLAKIDSITGTATASTISGGKLTLQTGTTSDLTITSSNNNALGALGLGTGVTQARTATTAFGTNNVLSIAATGGGTAQNITFGTNTGAGQVQTLDQLNAKLSANNLQATINSTTGAITIQTTNDAASASLGALTGNSTTAVGGLFNSSTAGVTVTTAPVADATSQASRSNLVKQYNSLLTQIDQTASDASFNGVNLLNGDQLTLTFNETGKSKLSLAGVNATSAGLGLSALTSGTDFIDNASTNKVLTTLNTVNATLRSQASTFGSNLSVVQTRQDFNKNLINVLQTGAANLTQADINLEAANSQALSTRQSLSVSALSLANQSQQSVLQLLR